MAENKDFRDRFERLLALGDVKQAVALALKYTQDSALDPQNAVWLLKHVRAWHTEKLQDEQRAVCEIILSVVPEQHEALHLLGYDAQAHGDFGKAEEFYRRALASKPDYAFSKLALAQIRMMRSGFAHGRDSYEARFDAVTEASGPDWRGLPFSRWRGENLQHKHIYLWAEQGLGDIVMFAGFLPWLLAQKPKRIALGMFPKLIPLFKRSFPDIHIEPVDDAMHHALGPSAMEAFPQLELLSETSPLPFSLAPLKAAFAYTKKHGRFDFAGPMGDMMAYGMPGYIPALQQKAYLHADPVRVVQLRRQPSDIKQGRRIGISWMTTSTRDWMRNIPLNEWLPILRKPDCRFISLQHHVAEKNIKSFCAENNCDIAVDASVDLQSDAEGLAALIASMDEVITIDNSNAHLAGSLGIPTTLLLPVGCNYRWPERKNGGTLWYQSVRTLRQTEFGNWKAAIQQACVRLNSGCVDSPPAPDTLS